MVVQLVRHHVPNRPDWIVVSEKIPIGTKYEVIGYDSGFDMMNLDLGELIPVEAYFLIGNSGSGWMPTFCFEVVKEES